jgi:hypothetical protein
MEDRMKRYFYPAIFTIVFFLILYIGSYVFIPSNPLHNTPIFFQILLWVLVYFGMIAGSIRTGSFGWDEL